MNDSVRAFLYSLGILAVLYIVFRYILPFVFKLLGIVIGGIFYIIVGIVIVLALLWGISWLIQYFKK